jgi:hypothetical protein
LNVNSDKITREQIDDFANAIEAFSDIGGSQDVASGAPELGRPVLTVHTSNPDQ